VRELGALRAIALLPLLAAIACAHSGAGVADAASVAIERAIVRDSDAVGGEVAAYVVFVNSGAATSIVDAECACADTLEYHLVGRENAGPGMQNAWPLALPANSRTEIAPPGVPRHLMLVGIREPVEVGERLTLRFRLADGSWIEGSFLAVPSSTEAWRTFDEADGG
jgi:copper(I)-binding protein